MDHGAVETAQALKVKFTNKKAQAKKDYPAKHKTLRLPRLKAEVNGETLFSTDDSYDSLGGNVADELPDVLGENEIGVSNGEGKTFVIKLNGN